VVHERDARIASEAARDRLVLVTCWPFDTLRPGTDLRFVVLAERMERAAEPHRPATEPRGLATEPRGLATEPREHHRSEPPWHLVQHPE